MRPIYPGHFLLASLAVAVCSGGLLAEALEYDLKDPKGVHNVAFVADSTLEPIMGLASGISGTLQFDPKKPKETTGRVVVEASSLHIEHSGMKRFLHGEQWLDVEEHPTIEFSFTSIKKSKKAGKGRFELKAVGEFTCKGKTKEITVPVVITHLPGKLGDRQRGADGDLVVLRSAFSISRKDYGIKPEMGSDVVADEIEVRVALVGGHPHAS